MEGEALLLGNWDNVQDMEAKLTLAELELIVSAARDQEMRHHKFLAALKGVNLDENAESPADRVEEMKKRIEAQRRGMSVDEMEFSDDFGIKMVKE